MSHRQRDRIGRVIGAKREIADALHHGRPRRVLTVEECGDFVKAITQGVQARFGIVKLKAIDLNASTVPGASPLSLIEFASALGQDGITSALLRSGADPSAEPGGLADEAIVLHLWSLPLVYAVYLINLCTRFRLTSEHPDATCSMCRASAPPVLLQLPACTHALCKRCFYQACVLRADEANEARCPLPGCGCSLETGDAPVPASGTCADAELELEAAAWERQFEIIGLIKGNSNNDGRASSEERRCAEERLRGLAEASLARFRLLPQPQTQGQGPQQPKPGEEEEEEQETEAAIEADFSSLSLAQPQPQPQPKQSGKASKRFRALPLRALASRKLGPSREKRSEQLFAAAQAGNLARLLYLLAAGVDIEARNEYGQTALFLASWKHGQESPLARVLRAAGALDVPEWTGLRPSQFSPAPALASAREANSVPWSAPETGASPLPLPSQHLPTSAPPGLCADPVAPWGVNPVSAFGPLVTLIPPSAAHAGAGSYYVDGTLSEALLARLAALPDALLPVSAAAKAVCSDRYYWSDAAGVLVLAVAHVLAALRTRQLQEQQQQQQQQQQQLQEQGPGTGGEAALAVRGILPNVRFLAYRAAGGVLPPHVDLCRKEAFFAAAPAPEAVSEAVPGSGRPVVVTSTHTFILYLTDCAVGGETALLTKLPPGCVPASAELIIAAVKPVRGRLFFFPHACPHEGREVQCVPKLLVRGEMF